MPLPDKIAAVVRSALPGVVVAAVAGHFAVTLAYLIPMSPLKLATASLTQEYMDPVFSQRWELFAPDPAATTRTVLVRCRLAGSMEAEDDIPWLDATSQLRRDHYKNRLGYADRLLRAQTAAASFLAPPADRLTSAITKAAAAEDPALAKAMDEQTARSRETGKEVFARIASAECDRKYGEGRTREVRVRIVTETAPPYSKRNEPLAEGKREAFDLDWTGYQAVDGY